VIAVLEDDAMAAIAKGRDDFADFSSATSGRVAGDGTVSANPFDEINRAALARLPSLVREWFPHGKLYGHEWRCGSIDGEPGESFSINIRTGKWGEFNGMGQKGRDVIGLYAAKFCGGNRISSARALGPTLGIGFGQRTKRNGKDHPEGEEWIPLVPPPNNIGEPPAWMLQGFDFLHRYTALEDRETHYVGRIEARGDEPKKFVHRTYGVLNDKRGWHSKWPAAPYPLYGLNKIAAMPGATVLMVEGEKKCDAAQRMYPDHACLSLFGGSGQANKADLAPLAGRDVIYWPDADAPGLKARDKIVARLAGVAHRIRTVHVDDLSDGFDAADLERQGCDDPLAWLQARLRDPEPQPQPDGDRRLRLRYGFDATAPQPLGTIVEGLLHAGSVTLIYGPPKSGKSFVITDAGLSIADHQPEWMGHKSAAAKKRVWDRDTFPAGFILATGRPMLISVDARGQHYAPDPSSILKPSPMPTSGASRRSLSSSTPCSVPSASAT
jgi:hypothetical protein